MNNIENIKTFKSEFRIPSHEQNAIGGVVGVYQSVVKHKHAEDFADQLKKHYETLPMNQCDSFDESNWDNIHCAELYVVPKSLVDEYLDLKKKFQN